MSIETKNRTSLSCNWTLDYYINVFYIINDEYTKYCNKWIEKVVKKYNLRKTCVCDIYSKNNGIDKDFKEFMDCFIEGLALLSITIAYKINNFNSELKIRSRVKDPQSILDKINKKSQGDKYPINKCLNDLFGLRIVDSNYKENIDNIIDYLECSEYNIRKMSRIKEDYKGYHIYFKQDKNIYFPIELQIWDSEDEFNNYESHKVYKEDYVNWTDKYKEI
ncbi:hypothetical protein [Clostridium perfringens]|uniref:hypothetical protein n=1 Tax=Clostridium perfringens TaxID=1502 RepID=UPI0030CC49DE